MTTHALHTYLTEHRTNVLRLLASGEFASKNPKENFDRYQRLVEYCQLLDRKTALLNGQMDITIALSGFCSPVKMEGVARG